METYVLVLPVPPTLTSYYDNRKVTLTKGSKAGKSFTGKMISAEGNHFRSVVFARARAGHRTPPKFGGPLAISVLIQKHPLTKSGAKAVNRKGDLDNRWKALLDSLTFAGVIVDDVLFDDIRMIRGNPFEGGRAVVSIRRFDPSSAMKDARDLGLLVGDQIAELPF